MWWHIFTRQWNGVSLFWQAASTHPDVHVVSDASGSSGCGAYWDTRWLLLQWPPSLEVASIQVKELIPVILAAWLFGKNWAGKEIEFQIDNKAVVDILNSTTAGKII